METNKELEEYKERLRDRIYEKMSYKDDVIRDNLVSIEEEKQKGRKKDNDKIKYYMEEIKENQIEYRELDRLLGII